MTAVIQVCSLTKKFGTFTALRDFDLTVEEGTVHGFLGPNGSGKTTTIRALLGILRPTSGFVRVLGENPRKRPSVLKRVGYVPGDVALWPQLTGHEVFRALESLRGEPVNRRRERELIDAFQLDPTKKTGEYSTGNRRKVSLISALSADAEVLILDEPTAGLDPLMEQVFVEQVRLEQQRGASVLLSSHIMSEVDKLCTEVTIIRDGKTAESGTIEELRHLSAHEVTARLSEGTDEFPTGMELVDANAGSISNRQLRVTVPREDVPRVLRELLDAGVEDITAAPASIEKVFLSHYDTREDHEAFL